jgi:hypothetical protein
MSAPVNPTTQWALHYAQRGWTVFPAPPGEKKSHKRAEYSNGARWGATKNPHEIRDDFARWPDAGIGIPTGIENGFVVIETDCKDGKDGEGELRKLEAKYGKLPVTYSVISPSGSIHYYFRHPGPIYYIKSVANNLAPGIDTKGDAGMVLAPPTARDGKRYEIRGNAPIADMPEWLRDLVTRTVTDEEKRIVKHAPPTDVPTRTPDEIAKLERFVTEALEKNIAWFKVRENALITVWGMKRDGYGCEGYRIARLICEHEEFPETQHVARVDRFWNDKSANTGTASLNTFWKMCSEIGIKQTPEEIGTWRKEVRDQNWDDAVKAALAAQAGMRIRPPPGPSVPPPPQQPASKALPFIRFKEDRKGKRAREIIKGYICEGQTHSVFGPPKKGKSTFVADLCRHVADPNMTHWRGRKIKLHGSVAYFAFERSGNILDALDAYKVRDGVTDLPIAVVPKLIDVVSPECVDIVSETIRAVEREFGIEAVIVTFDTWNKGIAAGGGDEDKAYWENLGAANLRRIIEHFPRLHLITVGHTGKDVTRGERGSNAKEGDRDLGTLVDMVGNLSVAKVEYGNRLPGDLHITSYMGEQIQIDTDEDGEAVHGWIVKTMVLPKPSQGAKAGKPSPMEKAALKALRTAMKAHGELNQKIGTQTITLDQWFAACLKNGAVDKKASRPDNLFGSRKAGLVGKGIVSIEDDWVWITRLSDREEEDEETYFEQPEE